MTPRSRLIRSASLLGGFLLVVGVAVVGIAAPASASTVTYKFTTAGTHVFSIPAGVTSVHVEGLGGTGGNGDPVESVAGAGALVAADIPVVGGETLYAVVGAHGAVNGGGANGGGDGGSFGAAGGGGGASDLRTAAADLTTRILVAAGGGGASAFGAGGAGGAPTGGDGPVGGGCGDPGATGATPTTFGTGGGGCDGSAGTDGSFGQGGTGGERESGNDGGGGGGGGWFGGGGGGPYGGGGGGSSMVTAAATASSFAVGTLGAAPYVSISFEITPEVMSVAVSPGTIVPDGTSTATVTATISDHLGNGAPGEAVVFSSSDPGQVFGAVTDVGDGRYTASVTSSTTRGTATITGTDVSTAGLSATTSLTQQDAELAATGSEPGITTGVALIFVVVGGALMGARRRLAGQPR
ncbi:MAG: Ig-like domain-containing protein [Pseudolysinimonas sp.]